MSLLWLFFTLSSALSMALSVFSLRIRIRKKRFLKQNKENGILQFKAESEILTEAFRTIGLFFLFGVGFNSYLYYRGPALLPLPLAILSTFLPFLLSATAMQQVWNEETEHLLIKKKINTEGHKLVELEKIIESLEREVIKLENEQGTEEKEKKVSMLGIWTVNSGLNVEKELKSISKHTAGWDLHIVMPSELTLELLISDTLNQKFDILHIGAHSDGESIFLDNEELSVWGLSGYCSVLGVKLAVLLVCLGGEFAEMLLSSGVMTVVYMANEMLDEEAVEFANRFYMAFSRGSSVENAVKLCKMQLDSTTAYGTIRIAGDRSLSIESLIGTFAV